MVYNIYDIYHDLGVNVVRLALFLVYNGRLRDRKCCMLSLSALTI